MAERNKRGKKKQVRIRFAVRSSSKRITVITVMMSIIFSGLCLQMFRLQALDTKAYAEKAAKASQRTIPIQAKRGTITDRNGVVLASSQEAAHVIADPKAIAESSEIDTQLVRRAKPEAEAIDNAAEIAEVLTIHLGGSETEYLAQLRQVEKRYVVMAKYVPATIYRELKEDLIERRLSGVYRQVTAIRSYPAGAVAGPVVGFVNEATSEEDGLVIQQGAAGLEYKFNTELSGTPGEDVYEISARGRIPQLADRGRQAVDGVNLKLTIDSDMQAMADMALAQALDRAQGDWGVLIVQNPKNGEILAMSSAPGYDPANYREAQKEDLGNRAVTATYEPGSVQKILSWAAYADAGIITPDSKLTVPKSFSSGGHEIRDAHDAGTERLTARGAFYRSSNVATAMLSRQLGGEKFVEYMEKFGLGAKTGIELPGEAAGILNQKMPTYQVDRASFGQSMTVSAIQMSSAVSAAVNGGIYNPPTIIKSATRPDGKPIQLPERTPRRVISPEASDMVKDMMEAVVTQVSSNPHYYGVEGYRLLGKTGTAQRADSSCGCYRGYTASFVGVGTFEDPSVLVYLVVDNPKTMREGHDVAVPYVRDLMTLLLPHYAVAKSKSQPRIDPGEW